MYAFITILKQDLENENLLNSFSEKFDIEIDEEYGINIFIKKDLKMRVQSPL